MSDQFSLVEMPLLGGIDQHTDSRKVEPARVLRAENVQILKTGRFDKRYGTTAITTTMMNGATAMASSNTMLAARGAELLVAERARLLARSTQKDRLIAVDTLPNWHATDAPIAQSGGYVANPDIAAITSNQKYICVVYSTEGANSLYGQARIIAVIKDAVTGTVLLQQEISTGGRVGNEPRVISRGNVFVAVWYEGPYPTGNSAVLGRRIDMSASTIAWDSIVTLRSDRTSVAIQSGWDICIIPGSSTNWVLAYQTATGANRTVSLYSYGNDASLTQVATSTTGDVNNADYASVAVAGNVATGRIAVAYTFRDATPNDRVRVAYHNATTLANTVAAFDVYNVASTTLHGPVRASIVSRNGVGFLVAWMGAAASPTSARTDGYVQAETLTDAGAVTGTSKILYGASLTSKLISANLTVYAFCDISNQGPFWATLSSGEVIDENVVLVDFQSSDTTSAGSVPVPVCVCATRAATSEIHNYNHLSNIEFDPVTGSGLLCAYGIMRVLLATTLATLPGVQYRIGISRVDLETGARQSCELGGLTYFTGGVPCWYDGIRAAEVGFLCQPHAVLINSNGAGSLSSSSVYEYAIVQVQYDAAGNVHRGIPMKKSVTLGVGDNTVDLYIAYYGCTRRQDKANGIAPVTFEIYRTVANGTQLRLLYELQANSITASSVNITDLAGDNYLTNAPFLYDTATPDGIAQLAHVNPPSATLCMTHRDRVWLAGCPNRKEIWVSSKYVPGEAPFFSEALRVLVDDGGDITAIASMDDKAIIFKDDRVFMVTGDGPDDAGNSSDWSPPTRIIGTVGCIDPRSIAVTPIGILFQSRVGLSLLSRDLQVIAQWGKPVEDSLIGRTIVSAYAHKTLTEIRVLLDNGDELRFDYQAQAWLKGTGLLTLGARYVGSTLFYLGSSAIRYEDTTTFLDNSTWITMLLELAPMQAGGRLGEQNVAEVLGLFDYYTAHECIIEVANDVAGYVEPAQWTAAELSGLAVSEYALAFRPRRAGKSRIAKVRISDATPTSGSVGTGRGFGLAAVTLRVADKGHPYTLLTATQRK
jgi:hypothetical protein